MTQDKRLEPSFKRWMSWGMRGKGIALTARRISRATENASSLSQDLENQKDKIAPEEPTELED
jgi:hypothetical protein